MNSAEKQEAIKAISMKILDTVLEEKANDSTIDDIYMAAFDQLVQTCSIKGGSSQKLLPRRAASAGPLPMVSRLRKEVLEEVDRRKALPEIKSKKGEEKELDLKIEEEEEALREEIKKENKEEAVNITNKEEIDKIICQNKYKFGRILVKNIGEKTRNHIKNLIFYLITAFALYKAGFKVADPREAGAFSAILTITIAQLARDILESTANETASFYKPLFNEKHQIASRKIHREQKRQNRMQQLFSDKPKPIRQGHVRGRGGSRRGRRNANRTTRKVRN